MQHEKPPTITNQAIPSGTIRTGKRGATSGISTVIANRVSSMPIPLEMPRAGRSLLWLKVAGSDMGCSPSK
ncbi:hypothetical protein E6W36_08015 [Hankyongella ginsenosidimutans]|uniref:Uncharacterized protein n=1 Tax=Hankyongella ginsenosidimutans TaxID=1763828 RepID=A0A4D7C9E4_9SPHN|nr:hypothetical protein E6W36_08015 [Hankyongella ginsenosidimutans]